MKISVYLNKGKPSNLNLPRSEATKRYFFISLRKLDWNGYGYEKYKTRKDYLYLIILTLP
jgi:hypothetical protein